MRGIILGIWLSGIFAFGSNKASAQCSCVGATRETDYRGNSYHSAYDELKKSEAVFAGEVVGIKKVKAEPVYRGASSEQLEVQFKVSVVWKGKITEMFSLKTGGEGCLIGFKEGERYLVYTVVHNNVQRAWYCSRTRLLAKADADLKEFEDKGEKPMKMIETFPPKL